MQSDVSSQLLCPGCSAAFVPEQKFCTTCGQRSVFNRKAERVKDQQEQRNLSFLLAYGLVSFVLLTINLLIEENTLPLLVVVTVIFAVIDVVFAFLQPEVWKLLLPGKLQLKPLLLIIGFALLSAIIVSVFNEALEDALDSYSLPTLHYFEGYPFKLGLAILLIAVCPAIFEELAFRGFVYTNFQKLNNKSAAIYGSAFLFGLVHFSLLSLYWIIPFGIILAKFREKYNTIFYGIIGHFTHNAIVVLLEYYRYI